MKKAIFSKKFKAGFALAVILLLFVQGLTAISSVGASSWSKDKNAWCTSGPQGQSWITWSGYPGYYWQTTKIDFYWWNGSSWLHMGGAASGYVFGGSNTASAYNSVSYHSGSWQMPADWWGMIISTTEYAFFSCT